MYQLPEITKAQFAEAIADTDEYYIGETTVVIDTADYRAKDGSFRLEGYALDPAGNKHYVEARVLVTELEVGDIPYEWYDDDPYDDDFEYDEDENEEGGE